MLARWFWLHLGRRTHPQARLTQGISQSGTARVEAIATTARCYIDNCSAQSAIAMPDDASHEGTFDNVALAHAFDIICKCSICYLICPQASVLTLRCSLFTQPQEPSMTSHANTHTNARFLTVGLWSSFNHATSMIHGYCAYPYQSPLTLGTIPSAPRCVSVT